MKLILSLMAIFLMLILFSCTTQIDEQELPPLDEGAIDEDLNPVDEPVEDTLEPIDPFDPNAKVQEMGVMVDDMNYEPESMIDEVSKYLISESELLFSGGFADLTIIKLKDESYLMYLHHFDDSVDSILDTTRGSYAYSSNDGLDWEQVSDEKILATGAPRAHWINGELTIFHGWHPDDVDMGGESEFGDLVYSTTVDGLGIDFEGLAVEAREDYSIISGSVIELNKGGYQIYFDEESTTSDTVGSGEIWSAYSEDGASWDRELSASIAYSDVEKLATGGVDIEQVLKPKVLYWESYEQYVMFYNSHSEVFLATSLDGVSWEKEGAIGIHGADVDAIENDDGSLRLYYGDWSEETSGVVYTVVFDYVVEILNGAGQAKDNTNYCTEISINFV
jgi:hypothetical protein